MKQETFQKALMATARITCCASIFGLGCQAEWVDTKPDNETTDTETEEESNNTDTSTPEDTSAPNETGTNVETGETTVDTGGQDTSDTQDTNDTQDSGTQTDPVYDEECEALITEAFPDPNQWPNPETIAQEVKDCCQLAAEYYDELALQADGSFDWNVFTQWEHQNQCCAAIEYSGGTMACTPWGPPMPPKLKSAKIHRPKQLRRILVRHA